MSRHTYRYAASPRPYSRPYHAAAKAASPLEGVFASDATTGSGASIGTTWFRHAWVRHRFTVLGVVVILAHHATPGGT